MVRERRGETRGDERKTRDEREETTERKTRGRRERKKKINLPVSPKHFSFQYALA
jgi:hypothetical protein